MESVTTYFDQGGPANTERVMELAGKRAKALDLAHIVVASYSGRTGEKAAQVFRGKNLVVVGGVYGFRVPNESAMQPEHRTAIEQAGGRLLFAGHAFAMLDRAIRKKFSTVQSAEIIAHVLRLFSQGLKVACEVTCMAVDAGLVPSGEEVLAIGGTGEGADTAIIVRSAPTHEFFDSSILEIICKPRS